MKIYFAGSIRGGRGDQQFYQALISELKQYGEVLTEHVGQADLSVEGEQNLTNEMIFQRDLTWLGQCDVLIAEVTIASLGVGYEIARAELMNKKIICLFRQVPYRKLSAMISGNSQLVIQEYETLEDAREIFFQSLAKGER